MLKKSYIVSRFISLFLLDVCINKLAIIYRFFVKGKNLKQYGYGFVFTSDLGDTVLFSTFLLSFMKNVSKNIIVITSKGNIELLRTLFSGIDYMEINYSKYRCNIIYRIAKVIKLSGISLLSSITPMRSRDYRLTDSVSMVTRKDASITFLSDNSNRNRYEGAVERFIYDEVIDGFSYNDHEFISYELLLKKYRVDFMSSIHSYLDTIRTKIKSDQDNIGSFFSDNMTDEYVVLNVGASMTYKKWRIDNFISLAKEINTTYGVKILFIGGPSEADLVGKFEEYPFIVDLILKTSFLQLLYLVMNSKFTVSNDSFVGHYATFLGVPTFVLLGGGHFGRFMPYPKDRLLIYTNVFAVFDYMSCFNCLWNCSVEGHESNNTPFPCLESITVSQVLGVIGSHFKVEPEG